MGGAGQTQHERLPWRGRLWPVAPALLVASGVAGFSIDSWEASTPTLLLSTALPIALAIVATGLIIGGRRGVVTGVLLTGLAAYWAWWFGWALDATIAPFSVDMALTGLADAAQYVTSLLLTLWPIVLAAAIVVAVVARRRGRRVWTSLGRLALLLVVLSFPFRATWDDGCNDHSGASPLLTVLIAQRLMDLGIGVIPNSSQTLVLCEGTGDQEWKPFWLGGDGLPPGPRLGRAWPWPFEVPTRLYRDPEPLPGRAFSHVALAYTESDHLIVALVVVPRYLPTPLPHQRLDFRADGVPTISSASVVGGTRTAACYTALWRRRPGLPPDDPTQSVRITYEWRGRVLAAGSAPVQRYATPNAKQPFFRQFGC